MTTNPTTAEITTLECPHVYVVRLTDEELQRWQEEYEIPDFLSGALESAHPEHAERQTALEEIARSASAYFRNVSAHRSTRLREHLADAVAAYESLGEGRK